MYIQFGFQFAPDNLSFKPPTGINGGFCSNEILEVHTHETCRKQVVWDLGKSNRFKSFFANL